MGYLLPPKKMCSLIFLREVFKGEKSLLKIEQAKQIPKIPRIAEINIKKLWDEIKKDQALFRYFPNVNAIKGNVPDRNYFFTVN